MGKDKMKGNKFKSNKVILFPLALIMLIVLTLNSYGAFQCNVSTSTSYSGGSVINISISGGERATDISNFTAEIYMSSASTANSTAVLVANVSNSSSSTFINWSIPADTTIFIWEDASDTIIRANVWNGTNGTVSQDSVNKTGCVNRTAITIDRTAPTTPTGMSPTSAITNGSTLFSISGNVNGANTTGCILRFNGRNPGNSAYAMTHIGNTCTLPFTNFPQASYIYTIEANDGTNTSITSEQTFRVDIKTSTARRAFIASGGGLPQQASTTAQQRAFGQQSENALDKAISKAPPEIQQGLTKAKETITKQYKGKEGLKTWIGTGIGCTTGFTGLIIPPVGLITIPAGCIGGHIIGMMI